MSLVYDAALAPTGLKSTQYSILSQIARHEHNAPTMGELALTLAMDRSTLGHNLRPLERDGLIALTPNDTDGRSKCVTLTEEGRARLAEARPFWSRAQRQFEESFGADKAAALRAVLHHIATNLSLGPGS